MKSTSVWGPLVIASLIALACTQSPTPTKLTVTPASGVPLAPTPDIEATVESLLQERLAEVAISVATQTAEPTVTAQRLTPTSPAEPTPDIRATIETAVRATIAARFKITITPKPGGFWTALLDPEPGPDGRYPAGTRVKLTVRLHLAHSLFVAWEGDASGTSPTTTMVVDRDLNVHAAFLHIGTATARPPTRTPIAGPTSGPATTAPSSPPPTLGTAIPVLPPPPTFTPMPASVVRIASLTSPILRGNEATLNATVPAEAECSITVRYKSGPSRATGLEPKRADSDGKVSWTWTVGGRTTPGIWPVEVRCVKDGSEASDRTSIAVES